MSLSKNSIVFRGRYTVVLSTASAVLVTDLSPTTLDARLNSVSDNYLLFRFRKMRVRLMTISTSAGEVPSVVAYTPNIFTADPTTFKLVCEGDGPASIGNGLFGQPEPCLHLSSNVLNGEGNVRWWRRSTALDDQFEIQGSLFYSLEGFATFALKNYLLVIEYEVELGDRIDPTLSQEYKDATPRVPGVRKIPDESDDHKHLSATGFEVVPSPRPMLTYRGWGAPHIDAAPRLLVAKKGHKKKQRGKREW